MKKVELLKLGEEAASPVFRVSLLRSVHRQTATPPGKMDRNHPELSAPLIHPQKRHEIVCRLEEVTI